ncbi:DNA sulfur modification protein DndB [Peribacillus simplex]|uniref:DNA sulfur modification protein DndB n=1 Tax=Peribacillus simplex TaxID=1478 RepID=UPI003CFA25E2
MNINAIKYEWQEYTCYIGIIKYNDVPNLINVDSDLSMNREINPANVGKVIKYINNELDGTFFPPVILSCNVQTEYESNQLKILEGHLTIIDGQHRIKAIGEILDGTEGEQRSILNNIVLPVLIIEGLESSKHRDLFNMINDKAKTVDSNISVRFSSTLENIIGLKYVSEKSIKEEIEWEAKQSRNKVVYLHIVESIKALTSTLKELTDELYSQETLLYDQNEYFNVIRNFLDKLFGYVLIPREMEEPIENFFKKKVFLRAVTDEVCDDVKFYLQKGGEKKLESINLIVEQTLSKILNEFVIPYTGVKNVKDSTYLSLRNFLKVNSLLVEHQKELESVLPLILNFLDKFYNKQNGFEYSQEDFQTIKDFIEQVIEQKDKLEKLDLSSISFTKNTVVQELLGALEEETQRDEVTN